MWRLSNILFALLLSATALGQQNLLPLNWLRHIEIEQSVRSTDSTQHTALRPYLESKWDLSHVWGFQKDTTKYYYKLSTVAARDHMFEVHDKDFWVAVDPLFDLQMSWDLADTSGYQDTAAYYNNTRGARIIGNLGPKVSFETFFYENQSQFPEYIRNFNDSTQVIPGQGRFKPYKNDGYDYNSAWGWVSVSPNENLNLQIGHGKHFIGHGYRSMLLSDNAANYPYLKATLWQFNNKLQYSLIYTEMQNLERLPLRDVPESLFKRKAASFYYLNWIPTPRVEVGLFEAIMWQTWDSLGTQPFDYRTLIPILGINTAILGFSGNNNAMLGINAKIKLGDGLHVYGQMAVDNLDQGTAYQVGLKMYHVGLENLHLQFEYNYAPKNMYRLPNHLQSFSNMNQSITHPLGTYFEEVLGIAHYRWRSFYGQFKYHYQVHENLNNGNLLHNFDAQATSLFATNNIFDVQAGWLLNPKTNTNLSIGWIHRNKHLGAVRQNTDWLYLTIRTSLVNKYYDF